MSKVSLTVAEESELRVALDATDPIYYGTTVGRLPHPAGPATIEGALPSRAKGTPPHE
jgi:hypothetical protein